MPYDIVRMIEGQMVTTEVTDIRDAAAVLGLTVTGTEKRTSLRPCLIGKPKLFGFVGPCYGGERNGLPVIRYEDAETYKALSE